MADNCKRFIMTDKQETNSHLSITKHQWDPFTNNISYTRQNLAKIVNYIKMNIQRYKYNMNMF